MNLHNFYSVPIGLAVANLLGSNISIAGDLAGNPNLFFIKRNKNANEVHYDAKVENCKWKAPYVDGYWRDLAVSQSTYNEIKFYEKSAYGFSVRRDGDRKITITMSAPLGRKITSRISPGKSGRCSASATAKINGRVAELKGVYVYATANVVGIPTVHYLDLLGIIAGKRVFERVARSEEGRKLKRSQGSALPDAALWRSGATRMGRQ